MSAVPPTNRGRTPGGRGPVELLLAYTEEILKLEGLLRRARLLRRLARFSMVAIPVGILALYIANVLTWHKVNLTALNTPPIVILIILTIYLLVYGTQVSEHEDLRVPPLELELELARERRRLHAVELNLDLRTRQMVYQGEVPQEIERYRKESTYYRRIHNMLQTIIIIGALAASTLTSLVQSVPQLRWFAVGTTFSVGVAAGFTGYFKFRERSFYLQETSDSIDQELSAVNLGIGRYKDKPESDALTEFTEQVESLKIEQRKRQQQLEQPTEGRESAQSS